MRNLACGFLLFLSSFTYSQTTVIAKKTKDAIYVGSDSRMTIFSIDSITKKEKIDTSSVCKIYCVGKFNIAFIGRFMFEARDIAFMGKDIAKSFPEFVEGFGNTFQSELQISLERLRQRDKLLYQRHTKDGGYITQAIIFGVEADSLYLCGIGFKVLNNPDFQVKVGRYWGEFNQTAAGKIAEIKDTLNTKTVWKKGIPSTIKSLIEIEAKYHIETGGDVVILKVTRNGIEWIPKKNRCN